MAKLKTPYLIMRDGRPRWQPGPALRARGFKGQDLKYPPTHSRAGQWMDEADAHRAAGECNRQVEGAPAAIVRAAPENRTMAGLFARLQATKKFQEPLSPQELAEQGPQRPGMEKLRLAPITLQHYLYHMDKLAEWCGDIAVKDMCADDLEEFYYEQCEAHGITSTTAKMRTLKIAFNYAINRLRWIDHNPLNGVKLITSDGRCVIFEEAEISTILAAADWCGLPSIGDAFVVGVLAAQRKQDILAMPECVLGESVTVVRQKKRGALAYVPRTLPLQTRLLAMRARKAELYPGIHHTQEIINSLTGRPDHANAKDFGDQWRTVRGVASGQEWAIGLARRYEILPFAPLPAIADKLFMDTRDTGVTYLFQAECTVGEIANISGHSLKTVQTILDKHYFTRNANLAKSAGAKFDKLLENSKIRWA